MATINLGKVKGEPFRYEDFTHEQLEALKGKDFKYEDFSPEQLDKLKSKVKIGTVETLDADQKATVTSSVDGNVTTLNIGIPRGNGVNSYSGTREEYNNIADTIKDGSLVNITDENDFDDENLIGQVTMQRLNDIEDNFDKIKPHALTNPTNNLLATEAGTPLDAVQGKVLKDEIDLNHIPNTIYQFEISGTTSYIHNTLKSIGMSLDLTFQENMNLLKNINASLWMDKITLRCNSNNTAFNKGLPVQTGGFLIITHPKEKIRFLQFYDYRTGKMYESYDLDGTFGTWDKLSTETELKDGLKLIYNHKEYIPWTSIASGSYAAGEKRYAKTDIGLIKELLFVFQENSVYESMAYEYISITTGYGNLTTGYYQAQTTKGLFRIYYSEEGYIDIREVPNGLGVRSALYLPKI